MAHSVSESLMVMLGRVVRDDGLGFVGHGQGGRGRVSGEERG